MLIQIDDEIFRKYPNTTIGYLTAEVSIQKSDLYVESLKQNLPDHLKSEAMNPTNFVTHPSLAIWRQIYEEDFGVNAKTHRSSIEALVRRIVTGKALWSISNIVDLYNCCSVLSLLPMGGYDLDKIRGDIHIRYAKEKEPFLPLGEKEATYAASNHVVYADNERILCWLWNHKDSKETCLTDDSKRIVFFIDGFNQLKVESALQLLYENLVKIGSAPLEKGILHQNQRSICLNWLKK